ncbi:hypothetical protein DV735_g5591, partial [Chaetothyriales sp. CBS 134920]
MAPSIVAILKLVIPLLPVAIITAISNALHLSQNSSKQSTKVETAVTVMRTLLSRRTAVSRVQATAGAVRANRVVKGPIWIAKASLPPPLESDALDAVLAAIKDLGNGSETFPAPYYANLTGEWTGWRYRRNSGNADANGQQQQAEMSEAEKYSALMAETTSPVTLLYFHGGAFFCLDPATHRHITALLAKRTGGRVFSLRYRLAPQYPFPSALLDCLLSYLYLLAPPAPGSSSSSSSSSLHEPIPASHIVFAGDSAGGNLALSLNLLILTLNRMGIHSLRYHGTSVPLQPPAGVAVNSPWCELTCSLPSHTRNAQYDYLPGPPSAENDYEPTLPKTQPCPIWPSSPPRAELYCSASLLAHPLVCPLLVPPRLWAGTPSVFVCVGEETLMDGVLVTARHILESGCVPVVLAAYEGMPHCGAILFPGSDFGTDCIARWAAYFKTVGTWMKALTRPPVIRDLPVAEASHLSDDEANAILQLAIVRAAQREQLALEEWHSNKGKDGSTARAKL